MIATAPTPALDFTDLWRDYSGKIRTYIFRKTSDPFLSDDLTADVFLKAFDAAKSGQGAHSHVSGWLYRIAHNAVIDAYRDRDRQPTVDLEAIADVSHGDTPHETMLQSIKAETLQRAMQRLTDEQAEILELFYLDGYTFGEIAAITGKTEGAAKAMKLRALKTLCKLLSGDERPPREAGRQEAVAATLREHGPMTMREIMDLLHERKGPISYALHQHEDLFVRVGTRSSSQGEINVWGLKDCSE